MTVKFFAVPTMAEPPLRIIRDANINGFRPKISERAEIVGWNTADASRFEIPDQKASDAVPFSFAVIV
jgi:hypothetical protein